MGLLIGDKFVSIVATAAPLGFICLRKDSYVILICLFNAGYEANWNNSNIWRLLSDCRYDITKK